MNTSDEFDLSDWLRKNRNYDIALLHYKTYPENPKPYDVDVRPINEGPFKNIHWYLSEHAELLIKYDYFWFPDDDLEFKHQNKFFDFVTKHKFGLCQPSVTEDSYEDHAFLIHRKNSVYRSVPFVEIMCPCFSRNALFRHFKTFNLNYSGYGLDLLWGKTEPCIVIDKFQIRHGRPQQFAKAARAKGWPDPQDELQEIRGRYL